jgi:uncharacterized FAD-dependent dehydrogenase
MEKVVIIGAGVAGVNAATKLVDNGYDGSCITIIDMGNDPYNRKPEEVMTGFMGAGGWSDGKLTYHTSIGGHLTKYTGDEKAMELMDQVITNFKRFHPKPEEVQCSNPVAEPDFIKPYFGLRLFPVWHVGTDYLHVIVKVYLLPQSKVFYTIYLLDLNNLDVNLFGYLVILFLDLCIKGDFHYDHLTLGGILFVFLIVQLK